MCTVAILSNMFPSGQGEFWPGGIVLHKLCTGSLENATYQISRALSKVVLENNF